MHRALLAIKRIVRDALSWDMMNEKFHVLAKNYILLIAYVTLESTFVNTLLYTVLDDISIVIFYRGIFYFVTATTMHLAAYLGQKKSPVFVIRCGAVLYMCTYVLLFFGLDSMAIAMIPSAILSGAGNAFYWSGHTSLLPRYTTSGSRDIAMAILSIFQGVMTLLVPLISGLIIQWMPGSTGYRIMFGIGMLAAAAQLFVQRNLVPVPTRRSKSQIKLALRLLRKRRTFQLMMGYETLRGFRDGAFAFILNMLLFEIVTSEFLVGVNTFLTGAAAIVGSWVYGKVARQHLRAQLTIAAGVILTLACLPLFALLNTVTVMLYTLVSSFFTLFIMNFASNTSYDVMGQNAVTRSCMGETAALREGALTLGRLSGLLLLLLLPHTQTGYMVSILILTASQILCGIIMLPVQRFFQKRQAVYDTLAQADREKREQKEAARLALEDPQA